MKLQNNTSDKQFKRKRWYDDACGTAFALDLIGERWSLLIMRELMFGPRRFSELRAGLPGISAKILSQRLEGLEQSRILRKRYMPSPVSAQLYELTNWGYEAEEIVQTLGRWATRHPGHDPTLPLSAASLMMSMRTMLDTARAAAVECVVGFRLGVDSFVVTLSKGALTTERREPDAADLVLEADPGVIAGLIYGGESVGKFQKAGLLKIEGDRKLLKRFVTLFPLPEKLLEDE